MKDREQNDQQSLREELAELSPRLLTLKKQGDGLLPPPPGYFARFEAELQDRIRAAETVEKPQRKAPWWQEWQQRLSWLLQPQPVLVLASALVLLAVGIWLFQNPVTEQSANTFASLTEEEVDAYIQANLYAFDTETIIEAVGGYGALDVSLPAIDLQDEEVDQYLDELMKNMSTGDLEAIF